MKTLVAAIALLCLSTTVLAHDIYSDLRDKAEHLCCNGQDCKPVQATVLPNGSYYLPTTNEIIPADMATPSGLSHSQRGWPSPRIWERCKLNGESDAGAAVIPLRG